MPIALVTGSGVRVGRAIATALADDGWDVICHAHRSVDDVRTTAKMIQARGRTAHVVLGDLGSDEGVTSVAEDVRALAPALDLIVHNAAIFEEIPFASLTRAQWRAMHALNVEAPVFLTQALLPQLEHAAAASVVAITDVVAERPIRRHAHYAASKAALSMTVRALALELAPIRVNAVAPGAVVLPDDYDDAKRARILQRIPLARIGSAEDIARAVCFLATNSYITGATIDVDGGRSTAL